MSDFQIASAAEMDELLTGSNLLANDPEQISAPGYPNVEYPHPSTSESHLTSSHPTSSAQRGPGPSTPGRAASQTELEAAETLSHCDNPVDFHEYFWPEFKLFPWQRKTLLQFAGFVEGDELGTFIEPTKDAPIEYALVAANGSGKSAIIIARMALWFVGHANDNICVVTSNTFEQLKKQTFRAIHRAAEDVNRLLGEEYFECTECRVYCPATRSAIEGVATDRPGRAEGYHPNNNGQLAFIADESKSISDELFQAFRRYHGYNTWIEVSSPAFMAGHFYERTMRAQQWAVEHQGREDTLIPGKIYARRVTAFECPGAIPQHAIDQIREEDGEDGYLYKTSILAEFGSIGDKVVIPLEYTLYEPPPHRTYNLPKKAGLDLSLGGDETVLSVWHGNKRIAQDVWHIADPKKLVATVINAFVRHGLKASDIAADAGGLGIVVIKLIRDAGWDIVHVNNESPAINKREHLNRGMELYWKLLRLIEARVLIIPREDKLLIKQLTSRRFEIHNGKQKLQSKQELSDSPDRADAMALAFSTVNLAEILLLHKKLSATRDEVINTSPDIIPTTPTLEQAMEFIEKRRAEELNAKSHQPIGSIRYASRLSPISTPLSSFITPRSKRYAKF